MPSRIDTTTRYHIASRDSEESDRESSPHEHLLSPSPTRSYTRAQSHWYDLITIEVEYFLRFAAIPLAIAAFALFLNDGRPDYTGADIFAMFIIFLNAFVILHRLAQLRCIKRHIVPPKYKFKIHPRFLAYLDMFLANALLISMHLGRGTRKARYHYYPLVSSIGVSVGYSVIGIQVFVALPQLFDRRVVIRVEKIKKDSEHNDESGPVLPRVAPVTMRQEPTGIEQFRQPEAQPRQTTSGESLV